MLVRSGTSLQTLLRSLDRLRCLLHGSQKGQPPLRQLLTVAALPLCGMRQNARRATSINLTDISRGTHADPIISWL